MYTHKHVILQIKTYLVKKATCLPLYKEVNALWNQFSLVFLGEWGRDSAKIYRQPPLQAVYNLFKFRGRMNILIKSKKI